jgi:hypothetical protein
LGKADRAGFSLRLFTAPPFSRAVREGWIAGAGAAAAVSGAGVAVSDSVTTGVSSC